MRTSCYKIDIVSLGKGDVSEFDKLFTMYYPKVKSFLFSMLADSEEAEDLAQDVFIRLWQSKELLMDVTNLNAYIYQTVKHVLYSSIEKKKGISNTDIENAYDLPSAEEVENIIYSHELETIISKTIEQMPPQRRQVFCMSRKQGLSIDEISKRLGISKRTVEAHISTALSTLRKVISVFILFLNC